MICKRPYKCGKKCGYFHYLFQKHKIFHSFGLCLQRFMENFYATHLTVRAFMVIKKHFQDLPTAGLAFYNLCHLQRQLKLCKNCYLQIFHWISKQVFYSTEIVFFVLITRCCCFGTKYVSRSIEIRLSFSESYSCISVLDLLLDTRCIGRIFNV